MTNIHPLPFGLIAVIGGERTGKTSFLRRLSGDLPAMPGESPHTDTRWLDLGLPALDDQTPQDVWDTLRARSPRWNAGLHKELIAQLMLPPHLGKKLSMLSTGSRRKVALVGLLACGATVTCLDQPYAALDMASVRVISGYLNDMAEHTTRCWVVADYEADPGIAWRQVISLD